MCCCTPERRTPFCQDCAWKLAEENAALKAELVEAKDKDRERLDWIAKKFFVASWNGVVGSGCKTNWRIAGDHRHTVELMTESTFLDSIDQAMKESK